LFLDEIGTMSQAAQRRKFNSIAMPHLEAAYGLARWLLGDPTQAEDAVQESYLRALRAIDGYAGGSAEGWILKIVRNVCLSALAKRQREGKVVVLSSHRELFEASADHSLHLQSTDQPDTALLRKSEGQRVRRAIRRLPVEAREVLWLREWAELSYREIADIAGIPIGTVMSRLSRARSRLAELLAEQAARSRHEM